MGAGGQGLWSKGGLDAAGVRRQPRSSIGSGGATPWIGIRGDEFGNFADIARRRMGIMPPRGCRTFPSFFFGVRPVRGSAGPDVLRCFGHARELC